MVVNDLQILRHLIDNTNFQTWGLCHGCFDLIHWGHTEHLRWCKHECDILVVSLTADCFIDKGPGRPLAPLEERMHVMNSIKYVDFVVPSNAQRASLVLAALKPDIYFKGPDRAGTNTPGLNEERKIVEGYGGCVRFSPEEPERHSTEMLNAVRLSNHPK